MKAPKIGTNVHIPGSKKAKVPALKKLGAPEDAVNGRITAQPSKEQVCRPLPLPLHGPTFAWTNSSDYLQESV